MTIQPRARRARRQVSVEVLEARMCPSHAPLGAPVRVEVSMLEQFDLADDVLRVRYTGPAGTELRWLLLDFAASAGQVRIDTNAPGFGYGEPCSAQTDCTPHAITGATAVGFDAAIDAWALDGADRLVLHFADFDPGEEFVFGLDLDTTVPSGVPEVYGADLAGTVFWGIIGGNVPTAIPQGTLDAAAVDLADGTARGVIPSRLPLTVITHGYQASGTPPGWLADMRAELFARGFHEEDVLLFDWAATSNIPSAGWAEGAGARLAAAIVGSMRDRQPPALHLIGHSRGSVVVSEATERLLAWRDPLHDLRGVWPLQITYLDPHPARRGSPLSAVRVARPFLRVQDAMADPDPRAWEGLTWTDVYAQQTAARNCDGSVRGVLPNLQGLFTIRGAYTQDVSSLVDPQGSIRTLCHSDVPRWYIETIKQAEDWLAGWIISPGTDGFFYRAEPTLAGSDVPAPGVRLFNGDLTRTGYGFNVPGLASAAPRGTIPGFTSSGVTLTTRSATLTGAGSWLRPDPMLLADGASRLTIDVRRTAARSLALEVWGRAPGGTWTRGASWAGSLLHPGKLSIDMDVLFPGNGLRGLEFELRLVGTGSGKITISGMTLGS